MSDVRTPVALVKAGLARDPDSTLLTFVEVVADGGFLEETRSYRNLLDNGTALAAALAGEGMAAGDSFALLMPNHPEFVDAMIGSELASTIFVPIDPRTRGDRLAYMLRFTHCRGVIVSPSSLAALVEIADQIEDLEWIWVLGQESLPSLAEIRVQHLGTALANGGTAQSWLGPDLDRPMQFLFTSGTTGDPKAMLAPFSRFATVAGYGPLIAMQRDERLYTGLSLTHANAQLITLGNALAMGLPLVISRRFTKSRLWEILTHYRCTYFNLLGGMTVAIFAEPPSPFDRAHKVRTVLSAGMPAVMWRSFEERFAVRLLEIYAAAEGGLTLNMPGIGPVGSVGRPPESLICAILDADDRELPAGERGEICFRPKEGEVAPVQYYRNPEASVAKTRGGWFRSGDIGYLDADGWLFFSHRDGSAIRRNGDFVNPGEIETEIAKIDGVADVFVYGVATVGNTPGEREIIAAVVSDIADLDPLTVFAHCRAKLGPTAIPSYVQCVEEIPKTASEKPVERHLREMLKAQDAAIFGPRGPEKIRLEGE
jgi:crotonobetaine/carnitine-CoA ligase